MNGDVAPYDVLPYSTNIYWCRCKIDGGDIWQASLNSRSANGSGCRFCHSAKYTEVNILLLRKERIETLNLKLLYPEIAEEWNGEKNSTTPDKAFTGSAVKDSWKCKKCYEFKIARMAHC